MDNSYTQEYDGLLDYIKSRLYDNSIEEKYCSIYLNYLSIIEESINEHSSNNEYIDAINKLIDIIEELKELDHTSIDNYFLIKKDIIKQKTEKNTQDDKAYLNYLSDTIDRLKKALKKSKLLVKESKVKIIAYLTTLAILIVSPVQIASKIKNTPKEKLYKTYKEIHTTIDKESDLFKPGYLYINKEDIPTFTTSYDTLMPYKETLEIKEYSPWIIEDIEGKEK